MIGSKSSSWLPYLCDVVENLGTRVLRSVLQISVNQRFLIADTFWLRKITTDPNILAHFSILCPDDRYPKLKNYIRSDFSSLRVHMSSIRHNALPDLILITDCPSLPGCRVFRN